MRALLTCASARNSAPTLTARVRPGLLLIPPCVSRARTCSPRSPRAYPTAQLEACMFWIASCCLMRKVEHFYLS